MLEININYTSVLYNTVRVNTVHCTVFTVIHLNSNIMIIIRYLYLNTYANLW